MRLAKLLIKTYNNSFMQISREQKKNFPHCNQEGTQRRDAQSSWAEHTGEQSQLSSALSLLDDKLRKVLGSLSAGFIQVLFSGPSFII